MDELKPKLNTTSPTPNVGEAKPSQPAQTKADIGIIIKPIRTYADDIKEAVEKHDVSVAKIIVEETKKRDEEALIKETSSENPKNIALIGISILFVLAGIGGYGYFYFKSKETPPPVAIPEYKSDIIKTESYKEIDVDGLFKTEIVSKVLEEQQVNLTANTIKEITFATGEAPTKNILPTLDFLSMMESRTPTFMLRAFNPIFLFGFHSVGENHPFLILKVDSFDNGYAGMIDWEKTIADDLGILFFDKNKATRMNVPEEEIPETEPATTTGTSTEETATTTSASTSTEQTPPELVGTQTQFPLPPFEDAIIKNKDIRVLTDVNGRMIMMYGFADTTTIVITTNPATFIEVTDRLKAVKLIQ